MSVAPLRPPDHGLLLNGGTRPTDAAQIDKVARDLEGVFAKLMISAMREASFGDSLFPEESTHFRDMYDDQLAKALADGPGLGLAPMIRRQLGGQADEASLGQVSTNGFPLDRYARPLAALHAQAPAAAATGAAESGAAASTPSLPTWAAAAGYRGNAPTAGVAPLAGQRSAAPGTAGAAASAPLPSFRQPTLESARAQRNGEAASVTRAGPGTPEAFVAELWPHAQRAARELGVCPKTIMAQAALETGWGRRPIGGSQDGNANNLFGIKATGRWEGRSVAQATREVYNGVEVRETAKFRAYDTVEQSFNDYVGLLKNSPRYADAVGKADGRGFAQALQRAGYATDPQYAAKLTAIAEGPTMRRALEQLETRGPAQADAQATARLAARG